MNLATTPALKPDECQPWWTAQTYTSQDGRTARAQTLQRAVIKLYGTLVMIGSIRRERTPQETCVDAVSILCLRAFRHNGELKVIGAVSWPAESGAYQNSRRN